MSPLSISQEAGKRDAAPLFRDTLAYDVLARLPITVLFGLSAYASLLNLLSEIDAAHSFSIDGALQVMAKAAALAFVLLVTVALSVRLPPMARKDGVLPRVVAVCGTFLLTALAFFPKTSMSPAVAAASVALLIVGHGFACFALAHLGRSLSIMAEARRLVTTGPYALVRHPLYAAEAVASVGMLLQFLSLPAVALWAVHIALQLRRMHYEEQILRQTFPEYEAYARRVPRVIPGVY